MATLADQIAAEWPLEHDEPRAHAEMQKLGVKPLGQIISEKSDLHAKSQICGREKSGFHVFWVKFDWFGDVKSQFSDLKSGERGARHENSGEDTTDYTTRRGASILGAHSAFS